MEKTLEKWGYWKHDCSSHGEIWFPKGVRCWRCNLAKTVVKVTCSNISRKKTLETNYKN